MPIRRASPKKPHEGDELNIGVLALQGDFIEHVHALRRLGATASEVRLPRDLDRLDGLIIPGGESTTIGKLAVAFGLIEPIRAFGAAKAIWGTCAGAILLSRDSQRDQPLLGLMDIVIQRNAFGRQVDSFAVGLDIPALRTSETDNPLPFPAVFIRAPLIDRVGPGVFVLARLSSGTIVAARQNNLLATSFHPELTSDDRFHQYFLGIVELSRGIHPPPHDPSNVSITMQPIRREIF
jgi:pyridoxal 5'-phosphate synthase pdxT subunit